ncbi:hypothetical protein CYMTET_32634 [Cymbomonas tetramitiformis]|uniref:Uncharacterized protein n=1 Tax=Cymbomonas tetramitiformis TaxID=36881 RepID=A0AAE0FF24_9CHLO|nr:hypothetical protein CYMTET_32634 [Cymbomonas tetramitiformis]
MLTSSQGVKRQYNIYHQLPRPVRTHSCRKYRHSPLLRRTSCDAANSTSRDSKHSASPTARAHFEERPSHIVTVCAAPQPKLQVSPRDVVSAGVGGLITALALYLSLRFADRAPGRVFRSARDRVTAEDQRSAGGAGAESSPLARRESVEWLNLALRKMWGVYVQRLGRWLGDVLQRPMDNLFHRLRASGTFPSNIRRLVWTKMHLGTYFLSPPRSCELNRTASSCLSPPLWCGRELGSANGTWECWGLDGDFEGYWKILRGDG